MNTPINYVHDDRQIRGSGKRKPDGRRKKSVSIIGICTAAAIAVTTLTSCGQDSLFPFGSGTSPKGSSNTAYGDMLLAAAAYPEMVQYPDGNLQLRNQDKFEEAHKAWWDSRRSFKNQPEGYTDGYDNFFVNSMKTFLAESDGENKAYSPLGLFMALSMSAEITDGDTRRQILDALAQSDIDTLRAHAKSIWEANYIDDGMAKCVLANSLWTNSKSSYKQNTMDALAANYYASAFTGDPGSENYTKAFQKWINEQTDGLLDEYVSGLELDPEMILTLVSTVNYAGKWNYPFMHELTEESTFHSPNGDVQCDFMNKEGDMSYFWGEKYGSISMSLEQNGSMRLILPDEGVSVDELLNDEETIAYMLGPDYTGNHTYTEVTLSVPKFDISSSIDLKEGLTKLGIRDAFDPSVADYTPLTDNPEGIFLSEAIQDTRVMIDEEGCKAASLTMLIYSGAAMPSDHVDFILDRPFIFEIMSDSGLPLFVGIVNNPAA